MEEFAKLIDNLCQRTSMFVYPANFSTVCAFIGGYDHARDGGPLTGFREWLIVRANGGNNMTWDGLLDLLLRTNDTESNQSSTHEQDQTKISEMKGLFEEFFKYRQEHGLVQIYHDYAEWLLKQGWYTGPLRKKRKNFKA